MNKPKLIFFGIKYFPSKGGTSRVAENIIRNLKDKYDITILCYKNKMAKGYMPDVNVVEFSDWPGGSLGALWYFFRSAIYLLTQKFDLIHVHKIDAALFIPWFYRKGKVIATSHESAYLRDKWSRFEKFYLQSAERVFLNSKATITSISNPLTQSYIEQTGREVIYIPNGITVNDNYKEAEAQDFLDEHELAENNYYFFAARRIMQTKGCHTMLEALDNINYKGKVVIAGDLSHAKDYVNSLQKKYQHLDVIYPGYIGDLPLLLTLIKKAKLFIFPSETEGMSIMLLEAVSTLTPIIASDIKENKEVFDDEHLTFFKDRNAKDLSDKIMSAEENEALINEKALNALHHIKTNYSWAEISKKYHNLYNQVLES